MNTTPYFPGDVPPVRPGVYKRHIDGTEHFSRWDGEKWFAFAPNPEMAAIAVNLSSLQDLPWCGLERGASQ